ncbi:hypothetical protein BpOF4_17955 [Alkalihalophilus pseudofirmus OF4]|uniref:Uncharacterized protein n=1 Tax=Alkalihalophilus pseudofirmus (strain ATCC BAA-2126 / JCM 17055 / OF4) TaxID=398511 RepID=D3FRZ7_ALKPO|nr:hypothetical protein [Alkalihalophilus pseudofirmus]ADC51632.1 hypothetical protein BpOF4_17955 [Alkalihalophilus pseudofirmus OF4]
MIRILLVFLIPLAFLNYIIFQTTVSGFVSLGILGGGVVIYLLQTPKKSRYDRIFPNQHPAAACDDDLLKIISYHFKALEVSFFQGFLFIKIKTPIFPK